MDSNLITRWRADKHARGSYSYLPPFANVAMRKSLCAYLGDGIFWAGEHCSVDWPATVNDVFKSGSHLSKAIVDYDCPGEEHVGEDFPESKVAGARHCRMTLVTLVALAWTVSIA